MTTIKTVRSFDSALLLVPLFESNELDTFFFFFLFFLIEPIDAAKVYSSSSILLAMERIEDKNRTNVESKVISIGERRLPPTVRRAKR